MLQKMETVDFQGFAFFSVPKTFGHTGLYSTVYRLPLTDKVLYSYFNIPLQLSHHQAPAITSPPTTFWTHHRDTIHATTTPGAAVNTFPRSAAFTTPITQALDPPTWAGWHLPSSASHTLFTH